MICTHREGLNKCRIASFRHGNIGIKYHNKMTVKCVKSFREFPSLSNQPLLMYDGKGIEMSSNLTDYSKFIFQQVLAGECSLCLESYASTTISSYPGCYTTSVCHSELRFRGRLATILGTQKIVLGQFWISMKLYQDHWPMPHTKAKLHQQRNSFSEFWATEYNTMMPLIIPKW